MIFVTVGSRNYPFDRLFIELDKLCEESIIKDKIFAQIGTSTYIPQNFEYKDFISQEEFLDKIKEAQLVISHGASGSIMKALNEDKKVIAVTRLEKYGEHINDHQIQNNKAFGDNGYVLPVFEIEDLKEAILKIQNGTDNLRKWENKDPMAIVNMIDEFIIKEQKNMKEKRNMSEFLKEKYYKLHTSYSKMKIKNYSRRTVRKYIPEKKLTNEQKQKIKEFYKPYKNITTDFHEFYYQKTGKFYENYLPDDLYYNDIDMYFNNWNSAAVLDNKCFYSRMFTKIKQPDTVAYRINNFWYDKEMNIINETEVINKIQKENGVFIKLAIDSAGGKGVQHIANTQNAKAEFLAFVSQTDKDIIIQKAIQQHPVLTSLNASSVNTIRILSLLTEEGAKVYSAILRMGVNNSKVDNASSGGITVGIDENGKLKNVAYFVNGEKYDKHPTSGMEFSNIKIPQFNEMKEMVIKNHPLIPHFRLVSWDIALDKNEDIVLIEVNLKYGELDFHQLNNGPLFGKDTKKILDEVFLHKKK